ncbi:MAG: phosphodiesterase [Gammaproteobacteria bacterium]|nr:phosphodiesterase [Gammaproteobacteria bacterium]
MRNGLYFLPLLSLLFTPAMQADSLTIPGHKQTDQVQVMPRRGIDMNAVIVEFGQPDERYEPIGEPPITEWVYGGFRVYFEHETVLHSINLNTLIFPK